MRHRLKSKVLSTLSVTLLFLTLPAFGQKANSDIQNIGNRDINNGVRMRAATVEAEMAMGRAMSRELETVVTLIQDPLVAKFVDRVSQNIGRNSDAKIPLTIRVVDSDVINATGLPGGFLYVNKGLILASDNEAEFASMIAREVAHIAARHSVESAARGVNIAATPLTGPGVQGLAIQQAASIGIPLSIFAFIRVQEEEADWLGLQYLYKAGYDPNAMATVFEKLQAQGKASGKGTVLFATPRTEDRIKQLRREIATILPAREEAALTTSEFETVKARLASRN